MDNRTRDASAYGRVAVELFLLSALVIGIAYTTIILVNGFSYTPPPPASSSPPPAPAFNIDLKLVGFFVVSISIPLFSAFVTRSKIVRVLEANKKPSERVLGIMTVVGYFFGLLAAGILLSLAHKKLQSFDTDANE